MITPVARWIVAGVLFGASWLACGGDAVDWSLKESTPGVVIATGRLPAGGTTRSQDFLLRLPGQGTIPSSEVSGAAPARPETWLVICVDHSGSMSAALDEVRNAVEESVRSALSSQPASLRIQAMPFATRVEPADGFSDDPEKMLAPVKALPSEMARDGKTRLYDAMAAALLNLKTAPEAAIKRLVVISDGRDEGSDSNAETVAGQALALKVPLDAIGYGRLAGASSGVMQSLARTTGGDFTLARNSGELARTLHGLLVKPAALPAAPPLVQVTFRYEPAANQPRVDSAILIYAPPGREPVSHALTLASAIAAPMTAPAAGTASQGGRDADEGARFAPGTLVLAAAVMLGAIGLAAVARRRTRTTRIAATPPAVVTDDASKGVAAAPRPRRATVVSHDFEPPRQGHPAAYLLCLNGQQRGYRYPIEKDVVRLGAADGNDLILGGDDYISRDHARIRYDVRSFYVQDLQAANGTYLNDKRLSGSSRALLPGDQIRVGRTTLELQAA